MGSLAACASPIAPGQLRQSDLDAWIGQPVEALDTQPFFITLPMVKQITENGVEIRNYVNGENVANCFSRGSSFGSANASSPTFAYGQMHYNSVTNCVSDSGACNNIFYIKNGKVLEYAPTGSGMTRCMTDDRVLPSKRRY